MSSLSLWSYLSSLFILLYFVEKPFSLTIKLVPRNSTSLPIRQPMFSFPKTGHKRGVMGVSNSSKVIRPPTILHEPHLEYLAEIGIGTFPGHGDTYKSYYLVVDTGSSLPWMQCQGCLRSSRGCYTNSVAPFPNRQSQSFRKLPCNRDSFCFEDQCRGNVCSFQSNYLDGTFSAGILARESFTIASNSHNGHETISLGFGCSLDITPAFADQVVASGILGLGWGPRSFVSQLGSESNGRFSYCLPSMSRFVGDAAATTYLRFGADIVIPRRVTMQTTTLYEYPGLEHYYLDLRDLSLNQQRLHIPPEYFEKTPLDSGCIFDSGSGVSILPTQIYEILKQAVEHHLAEADDKLIKVEGSLNGYELCYGRNEFRGYQHLPSIAFHFGDGAVFEVEPKAAFYVKTPRNRRHSETICLAILRGTEHSATIIGAFQQTNKRIIFDTFANHLYFGPQDCSRNP